MRLHQNTMPHPGISQDRRDTLVGLIDLDQQEGDAPPRARRIAATTCSQPFSIRMATSSTSSSRWADSRRSSIVRALREGGVIERPSVAHQRDGCRRPLRHGKQLVLQQPGRQRARGCIGSLDQLPLPFRQVRRRRRPDRLRDSQTFKQVAISREHIVDHPVQKKPLPARPIR